MNRALPSKRAQAIVRKKMLAQMASTITITRPTSPVFDTTTGLMTAHDTGTPVWSGPARIHPVSGGGQTFLGSEDTVMRTANFSIMEEGSEGLRVGDLVKVDDTPDDQALVGREFRVLDVSLGGILDPVRTLATQAIEPNPFWTNA